uniref:Uncharacterized protein n=1 Tax=Knipowitschia caucasica TaxID=637954 RepID=A0AAV2JJ89_KNICA
MEEAICGGVKTWQPGSILSNERQAIKRQAAQSGCTYAGPCSAPSALSRLGVRCLWRLFCLLTIQAKSTSGQSGRVAQPWHSSVGNGEEPREQKSEPVRIRQCTTTGGPSHLGTQRECEKQQRQRRGQGPSKSLSPALSFSTLVHCLQLCDTVHQTLLHRCL